MHDQFSTKIEELEEASKELSRQMQVIYDDPLVPDELKLWAKQELAIQNWVIEKLKGLQEKVNKSFNRAKD
jgi:hypothetical protein